jgi:hypothetical protein
VQQQLPQEEIQKTGLSVQAASSNNSDTLKLATVVQQFMTELSEIGPEQDKIMVIKNLVFNLLKKKAARFHKLLKVITFSANGIWKQHCEHRKHLGGLHIVMAQRHISTPMKGFLFQIITSIGLTAFR